MELTMTQRERDRLKIMEQVAQGQLSTAQAGGLLGLSPRQVQRLMVQYAQRGDCAAIHALRGRRPNNALSLELLEQVKELLMGEYRGFGPTLAAECLERRQGIPVSRETVRRPVSYTHLTLPTKRIV